MSSQWRKRRTGGSSLIALILAGAPFAGACLICAVITLGLRLPPPVALPEKPHDNTRCVLVSPPGAADIQKWERNLYSWADLRDPTIIILPHERRGFSLVRRRSVSVPMAPLPAYASILEPEEERPPERLRLSGETMDFEDKLLAAWKPFPAPPREPVVVQPLRRGIFWRRPDGRIVGDVPALDEEVVRSVLAASAPPKHPTSILVSRPPEAAAARIQVTRSCGNRLLDLLAVHVIRRAVGELELRERYAGEEDPRPSYFPVLGGISRLEVEWNPPAADSS